MNLRLSAAAVIAAAACWHGAAFAQVDPTDTPLPPPTPRIASAPPPANKAPRARVAPAPGTSVSVPVPTFLQAVDQSGKPIGPALPYGPGMSGGDGMMSRSMAPASRTEQLLERIRNAPADAMPATLAADLATELGKEFDARIAEQETEVKALEARVAKLRGQLDARKAAKAAIVQRRAEDLVNEAKGLGWPAPGKSRSGAPNMSDTMGGGLPGMSGGMSGMGNPFGKPPADEPTLTPKPLSWKDHVKLGRFDEALKDPNLPARVKAELETIAELTRPVKPLTKEEEFKELEALWLEVGKQADMDDLNTPPEVKEAFRKALDQFDPNVPQEVKDAAKARGAEALKQRDANNLKQILLALHAYHDAHGKLPAPDFRGPDGKAAQPHSWRVALLPYLEQEALYNQYRLDEPWNSPHNSALAHKMPAVFKSSGVKDAAMTGIKAFIGPGLAWENGKQLKLADFHDGTSNTAMIFVYPYPIEWNRPEDFDSGADGFTAPFALQVGMGDGSVRTIPANTTKANWQALLTRAGGEVVPTADAAAFPSKPSKPRATAK